MHTKIKEFAKKYDIKIYKEIPAGWSIVKHGICPQGTELISNNKTVKSGERKRGVLFLG